jgi:hypothetical protein
VAPLVPHFAEPRREAPRAKAKACRGQRRLAEAKGRPLFILLSFNFPSINHYLCSSIPFFPIFPISLTSYLVYLFPLTSFISII